MNSKKICPYCNKSYKPAREWQKTCGELKCIKEHKKVIGKLWRMAHIFYHKFYKYKNRRKKLAEKR